MIKSEIIEPLLIQPQLVDQEILKKLLRNSYNESSNPFVQMVNKYSKIIIDDYLFYGMILFIIVILTYEIFKGIKNKKKMDEINMNEKKKSDKKKINSMKKKEKEPYTNINNNNNNNDYYANNDYISNYYSKPPRLN